MSGEGAVVFGVVGVVGGAALIASRLAIGGTELLAAGLSAAGRRSDGAYGRWLVEQDAAQRWECAARDVIRCNARIAVLAARAGGDPKVLAGLPGPLTLDASLPVEDLARWVVRAADELETAELRYLERSTAATVALLHTLLGAPAGDPVRSDPDEIARRYAAMVRPGADPVRTARAGLDDATVLVDAERVLGRLAPDVPATERAAVLAVAADVLSRPGTNRRSHLQELRDRVKLASAPAHARWDRSVAAATYVQALGGEADAASLRSRLDAVVAGEAELTTELDAEALAACERVRVREEAAYVRERTASALRDLGYRVDGDVDTVVGGTGPLRLYRDGWTEHAVGVVVDDGEVRTAVLRTVDRDGDDARRVDTEREKQWCEAFEVLQADLAGAGLDLRVTRLVPPGGRVVPVAARPSDRPAGAERRRAVPRTREQR